MPTTYSINANDRETMRTALFDVYGMSDRDVIGIMMCDAETARQRIIDALDAIDADTITDETITVARRAVIECSITKADDQRVTFAKLNVRLAAMLEGVTI